METDLIAILIVLGIAILASPVTAQSASLPDTADGSFARANTAPAARDSQWWPKCVWHIRRNSARDIQAQGRYSDAAPLYRRSLAIHEKALGPDHSDVTLSLDHLAGLDYRQGRHTDALPPVRTGHP
jgi:hypothetical protein